MDVDPVTDDISKNEVKANAVNAWIVLYTFKLEADSNTLTPGAYLAHQTKSE